MGPVELLVAADEAGIARHEADMFEEAMEEIAKCFDEDEGFGGEEKEFYCDDEGRGEL